MASPVPPPPATKQELERKLEGMQTVRQAQENHDRTKIEGRITWITNDAHTNQVQAKSIESHVPAGSPPNVVERMMQELEDEFKRIKADIVRLFFPDDKPVEIAPITGNGIDLGAPAIAPALVPDPVQTPEPVELAVAGQADAPAVASAPSEQATPPPTESTPAPADGPAQVAPEPSAIPADAGAIPIGIDAAQDAGPDPAHGPDGPPGPAEPGPAPDSPGPVEGAPAGPDAAGPGPDSPAAGGS